MASLFLPRTATQLLTELKKVDGDNSGIEAETSSRWSFKRLFSFIGDLTGSGQVDGSGDVSFSIQVEDDSHNHIIANVDGLQSSLDALQSGVDSKAATGHNHLISNVTGLQSSLDALQSGIDSKAPAADSGAWVEVVGTAANYVVSVPVGGLVDGLYLAQVENISAGDGGGTIRNGYVSFLVCNDATQNIEARSGEFWDYTIGAYWVRQRFQISYVLGSSTLFVKSPQTKISGGVHATPSGKLVKLWRKVS